ncbi:MAG: Crp/Fnr family transcriptional regulator [Planctomycetes bacterium]|nr:Crp/Fnr family transcriptional regulator [Planctomycetota bacterium]
MERFWFIKDIPLFERLSEREIRPIEYRSRARSFARGSSIPLAEDALVYLVTEGKIRIKVAYVGNQTPLSVVLEPGDFFGVVPGCGPLLQNDSLEAVANLHLVAIPNDVFHGFIERHSDIFISVTKLAGFATRRIISWLPNLVYRTIQQRIARLFLSLVDTTEFRPAHTISLPVPLSIRNLVRLTAGEHNLVTMALEKLENDDLLRERGSTYELLDPRRLAHMHLKSPLSASHYRFRRKVLR